MCNDNTLLSRQWSSTHQIFNSPRNELVTLGKLFNIAEVGRTTVHAFEAKLVIDCCPHGTLVRSLVASACEIVANAFCLCATNAAVHVSIYTSELTSTCPATGFYTANGNVNGDPGRHKNADVHGACLTAAIEHLAFWNQNCSCT